MTTFKEGIHITNARQKILSKEEIVALMIHNENENGAKIYFSKLTHMLENKISRGTISKIIDKLFDLGMITAKWENESGKWIRSLYVTGEYKEYFKNLSANINSDQIAQN